MAGAENRRVNGVKDVTPVHMETPAVVPGFSLFVEPSVETALCTTLRPMCSPRCMSVLLPVSVLCCVSMYSFYIAVCSHYITVS